MKTTQKRLWLALALVGVVCLAWLAVAGILLWAVLSPNDWQTLRGALGGRAGLLLFLWGLALVPIYSVLHGLAHRYITKPARLAEEVAVRLQTPHPALLDLSDPDTAPMAKLFNQLLADRAQLQQDIDAQIAKASADIEEERAWLSALMAELDRSVVVCNLDGQILLYNNRAKLQFKRLSTHGALADGGELIGLGRSIYTVFSRDLIDHAVATLSRRLQRGEQPVSAQCVSQTPSGKWFRVHVSPVRRDTHTLRGLVLIIENITEEFVAKTQHAQHLDWLADGLVAEHVQLSQALQTHTDLDDPLHQAVQSHLAWLDRQRQHLPDRHSTGFRPWPLEDVSAQDLLEAASQAIEPITSTQTETSHSIDGLWVRVEGYALLQTIQVIARALKDTWGLEDITLGMAIEGSQLKLTVLGSPTAPASDAPPSPEVLTAWWETLSRADSLDEVALAKSIEDVVTHHGGQIHCGLMPDQRLAINLTLPIMNGRVQLSETLPDPQGGRPEFYDFNLFHPTTPSADVVDQPLDSLRFTVFDTETTGLNPSKGDEIIQLGAVRVVNGRLLKRESFNQLIDPKRPIPKSSIPIHGITPADVEGQPTIDVVLPLFHRFCEETVLVAHNADFDMTCINLKAPFIGKTFDYPVLDTLLLSALVHPNQPSHSLDEIAARFGIEVVGRHTALGDALVTAEILIKLLPLLKASGIVTLGDALNATQALRQTRARY